MFTDTLADVITQLERHKRNRTEVMEKCINKRLNNALKVYYDELSHSASFLEAKGEERILKSVNKTDE